MLHELKLVHAYAQFSQKKIADATWNQILYFFFWRIKK